MSNRIAVMNEGRLEQVGAPQDVYELPSTEFVASFLGASNLLDGEVESADPPLAKVHLATGSTISLPADRLPVTSGAVGIGVRPEKLHVDVAAAADQARANAVEAVVSISTYTGVSTSYECTTDDGSKVVVYVQNIGEPSRGVTAGERVRLSWAPEHTFAVASNGARRGKEQSHG